MAHFPGRIDSLPRSGLELDRQTKLTGRGWLKRTDRAHGPTALRRTQRSDLAGDGPIRKAGS
jgi:hypothetical protein